MLATWVKTLYRVFSHDVMAAILVSQNNETAAMLVSQTNPLGVELFSYTVESSKPSFDRLINLVKYYPTLRKTAEGFDCERIAFRSFPPSIRWYFTRFVTRSHNGLIGQVHSKQRWLVGSAVKFSLRLPSQITLLRPVIEIASDSLWSLGTSVEEK